MGVQASLLIPAPLPAASPAASPSPSPLTIDTTMSPTNKSADKARSPLSPRGRRTSVGSSPIGSPTSPTAADRSPTNDRRALRRGNSKLTANSIMSLVVAEETNDTIGESDPDDSVIGIEVTPQERKQRTMSDNIQLRSFF
jgi:hypothetical protein